MNQITGDSLEDFSKDTKLSLQLIDRTHMTISTRSANHKEAEPKDRTRMRMIGIVVVRVLTGVMVEG